MLVRFLSYAASIIGAKRYKPLLISCLALVVTATGITMAVASVARDSSDAASRVGQQAPQDQTGQGQERTSLGGLEKKPTKEESPIQQPASPPDNGVSAKPAKPAENPPVASNTLNITLNTATVSLSQNSPDSAVTVTTTDGSPVQWAVSSDPDSGITSRIESAKDTGSSAVIRFHADNLTPGSYQFTVSAKDTTRNLNTSKTISVTVH